MTKFSPMKDLLALLAISLCRQNKEFKMVQYY